ncbi:helix-turn-helix transcriptional regulator [Acetobacter sp.]
MASELPEGMRPAVLTYVQAAEYLGISPGRLRNLKWMGRGPRSVTYGTRDVRFRIADLDAWLDQKAGIQSALQPARKRAPRPRRRGVGMLATLVLLGGMAILAILIKVIFE